MVPCGTSSMMLSETVTGSVVLFGAVLFKIAWPEMNALERFHDNALFGAAVL